MVLGVSALIVAEFVAGSRGVGYVIMSSASMFETTTTLAGTVLVTVPTIAVADGHTDEHVAESLAVDPPAECEVEPRQ